MKKIKDIYNSRLGFSFLTNIISLFISTVLFRTFWEEGDDIGMALLAEGAYGQYEPHILYSNTIYGKMICILQSVVSGVRWHAVMMYLFAFIASVMFVYVLSKDTKGRILSIILLTGSFYEIYVAAQFSKISVFIAIMSYMTLFECVRDDLPSKAKRILATVATICMFYSIILRYESVLLATLIAGCYGVCLAVCEWMKGEFVGKIGSYCKVFIPVFVIFALCILVDRYTYSSGGWDRYRNYFASVSNLEDYHYNALIYDLHGDDLKALGVSENDANMFITYESLETGLSTPELYDRISMLDKKGLGSVNIDFIKAWVANIYKDIFSLNNCFIGVIALTGLLFAGISQSADKKFLICNIALQAVLSVLILFYYQYSGRWCHRIVYALFVTIFVFMTYLIESSDIASPDRVPVTCIGLILAVGIISSRLGNEFEYQEFLRQSSDYDSFISYLEENKDTLFVADVFTMINYGKYDVFSPAKKGQFDNLLQTDSVFVANTPVNESIAAKYGYADPYEALASGDDKVILADNVSPDVELTFLNEHGDKKEYRLIDAGSAGNINLYRISN